MPYNPRLHHRRSIRLKDYDYSEPGAYFVTLVSWQREHLFGTVAGEKTLLNPFGQIIAEKLHSYSLSELARVEYWVVMPNHVHLLIEIIDNEKGKASSSQLGCKSSFPDALPLRHGS